MRNTAIATYRCVPLFRTNYISPIDDYTTIVTCYSRSFRYPISIKSSLCSRINNATQTSRQQETKTKVLILKIIAPCHISFRKYRAKLYSFFQTLCLNRTVSIHIDIIIGITLQIGHRIEIAQGTTFFQNKVSIRQSFHIQLCLRNYFTCHRMYISVNQTKYLVFIGTECIIGVPSKFIPSILITQRELNTTITYITSLRIESTITSGR